MDQRAPGEPTARVPRVGAIWPSSAEKSPFKDSFVESMRELGYVEGQNVVYEWRFAEGHEERQPALAAELVRLPVDVILTGPSAPTRAAMAATTTIPLVMAGAGDPVGNGLVASLGHPGGNVTGVAALPAAQHREQVSHLKEAFPHVTHPAVLWSPDRPAQQQKLAEMQDEAQALGMQLEPVAIQQDTDVMAALEAARGQGIDALIVLGTPAINSRRAEIVAFAELHKLPNVGALKEFVDAGGVLARGMSLASAYRRAAQYVDKILKGANPADLPVEEPSTNLAFGPDGGIGLESAVNMKAAAAHGFSLPQAVIDRADTVIR